MIQLAKIEDIDSIVEIYNQAIDAKFQTAFTQRLKGQDSVEWFTQHINGGYPLFVYLAEDKVVGWLKVSPYRQGREALRYTVEVSYYINKYYQKKGIGSKLMEHALGACREAGYKSALAILLDRNIASIKLLRKYGFKEWGYLPQVADFDGVESSHLYYGIKLNEGNKSGQSTLGQPPNSL